jgi:hypothetical protein
MFGGYSLLRFVNQGDRLTPFQVTCFRAGHAHAGVLLVLSLLYYMFLEQTTLAPQFKQAACAALFVGILAQSGGFFLHMMIGEPNHASLGTAITTIGAVLLASAVGVLIYALVTSR